ncbi:MAG: ATP-binding protein [Pseudomonadota bacterium]
MLNSASRPASCSIALMVSVALTAVITLVLAAFATFFYCSERDELWSQLRATVTLNAGQLAVAVAQPVWDMDDNQVWAIMRSALRHPDVRSVVVEPSAVTRRYGLTRDSAGLVAPDTWSSPAGELFARRAIMVSEQVLGTVSVYASTAPLQARLRQRLLATVGAIVVLDLALVLSLYALMWQLMLKPVRALGQHAASVQAGAATAPPRVYFFGELRTLDTSLRAMLSLLESRYQAMRRSEERLQMATRAAGIGIWDWNLLTDEVVWDEQMYRLYRAEAGQEGGPLALWHRAMLSDDSAGAREAVRAALAGEGEYDHEFRIVWPNGAVRHIQAAAVTFRDAGGRPLRMVGTNYDITAHKEAELELLRHRNNLELLVDQRTIDLSDAVTQAQQANRAKGVFLANMSHELRTPLNAVIGFSRLMADSPHMLPEEKRNLAIIHRAGSHLLILINDILELSKVEAGRQRLQTALCALEALLPEVMDLVSMRAGEGGVRLRLDCADLPAAVNVDATKLRQVLINLLSNAVKFAPRGEVTLRAHAVAREGQRCDLRFAVIDNGIGIAPADQARIFEPFIQAEGAPATEGTGLGLTISREFVRLMGGALTLESAPGQGACFAFTLCVQAVTPAAAPARRDEQAPAAAVTGAYPPGAYPPGAYPPGAYPPGAYPPGAYPPGAYPPGAAPLLTAPDLAPLGRPLCASLEHAVRELDLARVAALLADTPAALAPVTARIGHMLDKHQYRQLCALLADAGHAARAGHHAGCAATV